MKTQFRFFKRKVENKSNMVIDTIETLTNKLIDKLINEHDFKINEENQLISIWIFDGEIEVEHRNKSGSYHSVKFNRKEVTK